MKSKDALQNHLKKGRLITFRWLKVSKINEFIILWLSKTMKNAVMLTYKCNPLIIKGFLMRVKRNRLSVKLVLFLVLRFFNYQLIFLDCIKLLNAIMQWNWKVRTSSLTSHIQSKLRDWALLLFSKKFKISILIFDNAHKSLLIIPIIFFDWTKIKNVTAC